MSCSSRKEEAVNDTYKLFGQQAFENPTMLVGFEDEPGFVSTIPVELVNSRYNGRCFCQIEPVKFFPLSGVTVDNDVARFPVNNFYATSRPDFLTFIGTTPEFDKYKFLNTVLDIAQVQCKISRIIVVNAVVSSLAHTSSRRIYIVSNLPEMKEQISTHGATGMNWQGQPSLSTYLLWLARSRQIPAVNLWLQIPFYLSTIADFQAVKTVLTFLSSKFYLDLDYADLDSKIRTQNEKIAALRDEDPDVDQAIASLEAGLSLSDTQQLLLAREVADLFVSS